MPGCCDWDPPSGFGFDPKRSSDVVVDDDEVDREQRTGLEVEKATAPLAARKMVARVTSFVMVGGIRRKIMLLLLKWVRKVHNYF